MRIRLHEQARLDIQRGISFYESQSSGLGAYFKSEIIAAIDALRYFPAMHPMVRGYRRMFVGKFPYCIYYKITSDAVIVFSVLDARMNPGTANARLDSLA